MLDSEVVLHLISWSVVVSFFSFVITAPDNIPAKTVKLKVSIAGGQWSKG